MYDENAAPAATAKPCLKLNISDIADTGASIWSVLNDLMMSTADLATHLGELNPDVDDEIKDKICEIAAAKVGLSDIIQSLEQAHFELVSLRIDLEHAEGDIESLRDDKLRVEQKLAERALNGSHPQAGLIAKLHELFLVADDCSPDERTAFLRAAFGNDAATVDHVLCAYEQMKYSPALVEPAPCTNPEAEAAARIAAKRARRAGCNFNLPAPKSEAKYDLNFSGRRISLSGDADAIATIIASAKAGGGWVL